MLDTLAVVFVCAVALASGTGWLASWSSGLTDAAGLASQTAGIQALLAPTVNLWGVPILVAAAAVAGGGVLLSRASGHPVARLSARALLTAVTAVATLACLATIGPLLVMVLAAMCAVALLAGLAFVAGRGFRTGAAHRLS